MKYINMFVLGLLLFTGCSESEKQRVIAAVQDLNIQDDKKVDEVTALNEKLSESSGLAYIDGTLWTHNDSGGESKLYAIDTANGNILKTVSITNASNKDWEDLTFDETHLYIGDFGNNRGTRKDLKIYKIKLADLKTELKIEAEVIEFTYATQIDFESDAKTNYDCEAFIAYDGQLYLFSKNYGNEKTDMYVLSTNAGIEVAEKRSTFNSNALITGASMDVNNKVLALIGYSNKGTPKTWIFSEFVDHNFFEGKQKKFSWGSPAKAQIEGVAHKENGKLYISSEKTSNENAVGSFSLNQKLFELTY